MVDLRKKGQIRMKLLAHLLTFYRKTHFSCFEVCASCLWSHCLMGLQSQSNRLFISVWILYDVYCFHLWFLLHQSVILIWLVKKNLVVLQNVTDFLLNCHLWHHVQYLVKVPSMWILLEALKNVFAWDTCIIAVLFRWRIAHWYTKWQLLKNNQSVFYSLRVFS